MFKIITHFIILFVFLFGLTACQQRAGQSDEISEVSQEQSESNVLEVAEDGNSRFNQANLQNQLNTFNAEELSEEEKTGLIFMREEEKLAHDVYVALYQKWNLNIFNNISSSEQTHTEAVKALIDRYGLTDPNADKGEGEFANEELQKLYDDLIEQGEKSLEDALRVGVTVEEVDIVDLQKFLKEVDNEDIILVYENLLRGSRNHLRSFVRNMNQSGLSYSPQYLSQEEYDEIANSDNEKGSGGEQKSGQGGR